MDEKSILEGQDIEEDLRNSVGKSSDTGSRVRDDFSGRTLQAGLLGCESSSSLREVRFSNQKFAIMTSVSNINYNHPGFQNNNPFYPFDNQLDYGLV